MEGFFVGTMAVVMLLIGVLALVAVRRIALMRRPEEDD